MIRGLARLLRDVARGLPDPERDPDLGPFYTDLRLRWKRDPRELPPEAWEEGLLELIAERIAEGLTTAPTFLVIHCASRVDPDRTAGVSLERLRLRPFTHEARTKPGSLGLGSWVAKAWPT